MLYQCMYVCVPLCLPQYIYSHGCISGFEYPIYMHILKWENFLNPIIYILYMNVKTSFDRLIVEMGMNCTRDMFRCKTDHAPLRISMMYIYTSVYVCVYIYKYIWMLYMYVYEIRMKFKNNALQQISVNKKQIYITTKNSNNEVQHPKPTSNEYSVL